MPQVKNGDFIRRRYGSFLNKEIFLVDDVDEKKNGIWAHRVRVDSVGSQWIPMNQVFLCNDEVSKLSISAEDADYLASSHACQLDHSATKEWLRVFNGKQHPLVVLRNVQKQKELYVSNAMFIRTTTYTGKPPKKVLRVRIKFETFLRIKV